MNNFNELKSTIKGNYGEHIITPILQSKGYTVYKVSEDNKAHTHDYYITKWVGNKVKQYAVEIKTKSSLIYYEAFTIDANKLKAYKEVNKQIPLIFILIDDVTGEIKYALLNDMLKDREVYDNKRNINMTYPNYDKMSKNKSVMFSTSDLIVLGILNDTDKNNIRNLSNNSEQYEYVYKSISK